MGAMVALQSLESTQQQLSVAQKQISTGYRVADSTDDGAAYAIAQSVRSSVGALTSSNEQLGNVQGLLSVTQKGLDQVSNMMSSMRDVCWFGYRTATCKAMTARIMSSSTRHCFRTCRHSSRTPAIMARR